MTFESPSPINIDNSDPSEVPDEEPSIRLPPISRIRVREIHRNSIVERDDDLERDFSVERMRRNLRAFGESDEEEEKKAPYKIGGNGNNCS